MSKHPSWWRPLSVAPLIWLTLTCAPAQAAVAGPGSGRAPLVWEARQSARNGECLANPSGYDIAWGRTRKQLDRHKRIDAQQAHCTATEEKTACGPVLRCSYTVEGLDPGTWHFAISAYDHGKPVTRPSDLISQTIGAPQR